MGRSKVAWGGVKWHGEEQGSSLKVWVVGCEEGSCY